MYLKYKCIVPARFARRIYFLGTYNLGAHSLCISSSVFFPQRTNDLLTPNMPYNTCCLTSVFPNCVVQQLVVLFYWSGFFLHLMSFSSEYFRWYKTTCSQNAFLGNYGNSIYFKIGLGFFFHGLYDVLHEIRLGIAVAKNFWPELKIDSKFFFSFVTLYNELKSVD